MFAGRTLPSRVWRYTVLCLVGVLMVYPVLWMVLASLKPSSHVFDPGLISSTWTLRNYADGWDSLSEITFGSLLAHSFLISSVCVIGSVLSASVVAFAFARLEFRLKKILFTILIVTMLLPGQVTMVPQYIIYNMLGWVNTYLPLTVPSFLGGSPFFVFLMVQFIRGIPKELDEAAIIDGCSTFQLYWRIIFPLSKPALVTTAIFAFIWSWNDFLGQLIYINSPQKATVSMGLQMFLDQAGGGLWGQLFAMSTLSLIPIFIIFVLFQRHLVRGIYTGSLKG